MLNKPFLSIQELLDKTEKQRKSVEECLDRGFFHPSEASILDNQKAEDYAAIKETLRAIPLSRILEYLGRGQTLGDYFVADKVYDDIVNFSQETDKVPIISAYTVSGWEGADLKIPIARREGYRANDSVSGALQPTETVESKVATLTPKFFSVAPRIGDDLIDDAQLNGAMIEWHLRNAAKAIGLKATDMALTALMTATDGWGTVNSGAAGSGTTTWANIATAHAANTDDYWVSNTVICTSEAWEDAINSTIGIEVAQARYWQPYAGYTTPSTKAIAEGFDFKLLNLDMMLLNADALHTKDQLPGTAMLACKTIVYDRTNALFTGRKRWMQIDKYSDPVKDLAGAVFTCRQGSVTLYNDAVYVLTES